MTIDLVRRPSRFGVAAGLLASLLLAACGGSPSEPPAYTGPAFDSLVVTLSSTLSVGRTVRPTLAIQHRGAFATYEELPELAVSTRLESSNPAVLSVADDGSLHAIAAGRATVTARLADRQSSVVVDVIPGYVATYVQGTDGMVVAAVNDGGDVIGTTAAGHVLLHQGTSTDLGTCDPHAINNAGQIACGVPVSCGASCSHPTPAVYSAGALATPFDTASGSGTGITESGTLFGQVRGADGVRRFFLWSPAGVTYRATPTPSWVGFTYTVNSALNGIVVHGELYNSSSIVRASNTTGLSPGVGGRWSEARDINDSDDAVGTGEQMRTPSGDVGGSAAIWRAANGWATENPSYRAADATAISEAGYVVGGGRDGAYVWRGGRYTILTDALADAGWTLTSAPSISRNGKVAAIGQHTSGKRGVVLIDLGTGP